MMGSQTILIAVFCLLAVFLTIATAQLQQQQHQIQQYDPNTPPQHTGEHISARRVKRMYAMCPPHFFRIGNECYFISQSRQNWLDAHFECKDRNSKLAEPMKYDDKYLRKFLQSSKSDKNYIWIGGNYNWRANKWQWGYNGKDIGYQSFSQMVPGSSQDLKYHCAVLSPELKFRWSAKLCTEKLNFICQHKMPFVNSESRNEVYIQWNETFPNEKANEALVIVADQPHSSKQKDYYRTRSNTTVNPITLYNRIKNKKHRAHRNKLARTRLENQQRIGHPRNDYISNDIFRRPVVEYAGDHTHNSNNGNGNGYRNGNGAYQQGFNVDINRKKKIKSKNNDVIGEFHRHPHRHHLTYGRPTTAAPMTTTVTTATTTTTSAPETLPTKALQVATKNYHPQENTFYASNKFLERIAEKRKQLSAKHGTTTEKYQLNQPQLSHEEKKVRREKLRGRLAKLTPEEQELFYAERAKRKRAREVRAKHETIP